MPLIDLTPDELLKTTRSVRKRLDLTKPVPMAIIEECMDLALQAPTSTYGENWRFMIVTDPDKKRAIANWYKKGHELFIIRKNLLQGESKDVSSPENRVLSSINYLAENLQDIPALMVPCILGRLDSEDVAYNVQYQATMYASIIPAVWNFMLAARARGLGTCWTTLHLPFEQEVGSILGIPVQDVTQIAMIPIAYTLGTKFKSASRRPLHEVMRLNKW